MSEEIKKAKEILFLEKNAKNEEKNELFRIRKKIHDQENLLYFLEKSIKNPKNSSNSSLELMKKLKNFEKFRKMRKEKRNQKMNFLW